MSSESKAHGAALCESHTLGILFLSLRMNTEHGQILVPRQDSSISGKIHRVQRLAAAPCPEGTSCPQVTISNMPRSQLSAGTLLAAQQGEGSIPWPPEGCPPAFEGDFQHCIIFTALQSWVMLPLGSQDAC